MTDIKEKTACFTGHRNIPIADYPVIKSAIREILTDAVSNGYHLFLSGGALGFDTLAAQAVLELRESLPQIKLILALPCLCQSRYWMVEDVSEYEQIKKDADKIVYTSEEYTRGCMFKRNRYLVDNSSLCICFLEKKTGGTAYTVRYAEKRGVNVKNIAEQIQLGSNY